MLASLPNISIPNLATQLSYIPLALYIHVPWCVKKCPYCDFNSHEAKDNSQPDYIKYVDALLADAESQAQYQQGRAITSIFFGGGTPSLMPTAELSRLIQGLYERLYIASDAEITLEANPATVEHEPFEAYLQAGINRLSIGVQSFATDKLQLLGRIHDETDAVNAVKNAKKAGFNRINIDLMHGLPEQSVAQAMYDLEQAIALDVEHISWYQLTIEPNTVFYRSQPVLPVDEKLASIQSTGEQLLRKAGYNNYEVSAWTKRDACRHNVNYWQFGDYLAIGAGAHGKVTQILDDKLAVMRFNKNRLPQHYMAHTPAKMASFKQVDLTELPFEFMMNGLRLTDGVPAQFYKQRTGLKLEDIADKLESLVEKELIQPDWKQQISCTETGMRYLNQVLERFT